MPHQPTLDYLLDQIDFCQSLAQLQHALHVFDHLSDTQVQDLTSGKYIKNWEAGMVMEYLPPVRLTPYVASLLAHLQDGNWPAYPYVAAAILKLDETAIPAVQHVFATEKNDGIWLANLIRSVIQQWPRTWQERVKADLVEYVRYAERDGASITALEALECLLPPEEHRQLYQYLCAQYAARPEELAELHQSFAYDSEHNSEIEE
ncbi:MAG: DUF5071 domain-containing protein [Hymenobacter sp.]|nr:MAG: DUF5071 domain-containing protein [Hymenobacter sp.]